MFRPVVDHCRAAGSRCAAKDRALRGLKTRDYDPPDVVAGLQPATRCNYRNFGAASVPVIFTGASGLAPGGRGISATAPLRASGVARLVSNVARRLRIL